jgi:hypothetical protein
VARTLLILLTLCLLPVAAFAVDSIRVATIGTDEIRPGMKGYGLTVFRGTRPERFDVEVIDVLHNFRPDQDLILIRTAHPVFERATVVAGMSGSPIYLDGKLAGAYAYGWMYGKEPVAGVTPIANMLVELERPLDPAIWRALSTLPDVSAGPKASKPDRRRIAGLPPFLGQKRLGAFGELRQHAARLGIGDRSRPDATPGFRPVATPVMMGGFDRSVIDAVGAELEQFGLVPLQAGGGRSGRRTGKKSRPPRYVHGSAVGVQLIRGDINATATGTVTHVSKRRLVAFGHPLMNAGQTALPATTARVLHVLASDRRSFKISEPISPLGTLVHDRQSAIVVDTGLKADTVPVTIRVDGVKGAPRTEWKVEVASNRLLTPILTYVSIANAVRATASDRSHAIFTANSRVAVEGHGTIAVADVGYTSVGVGTGRALRGLRLFDVLGASYGNPFEETRVRSVEVDLSLRYARDVVEIVDAMVAQKEVDPGRPVNVYVTLRRQGEPVEVRIVEVPIPPSAAGSGVELSLRPGDDVRIEHPRPESLSDLFEIVKSGYPSTSLVISTKLPSQGLKMFGHVVHGLPPSVLDSLQLANQGEPAKPFATYRHTVVPLGRVVAGSTTLKLKVRETPREQGP